MLILGIREVNTIISKKGQLSMFIIIAVLILFVFGLGSLIYKMTNLTFEEKVEKAVERTKEKASENYISVCLKDSTEEAVRWVARRGGYAGQLGNGFGGPQHTSLNIAISNESLTPAPEYPYEGFSIFRGEPFAFGKKYLPFLCQKGGPNDLNVTEYARRCPAGAYGVDSIQKDLSLIIADGLKNCVNTESMDMSGEFEVEFADDDPAVRIIYGEGGMLAEASYPFIFKKDDESMTKTVEFTYEVPIRFKKIYGLADYLIRNDLYYIDFDMSRDFFTQTRRSSDYDEAMRIMIEEMEDNKTDIIHILDNRSVLDGKAVDFRFARQNRPPVLEPLPEEMSLSLTDGLKFKIQALDPDEDEIYVVFAGWRINYDYDDENKIDKVYNNRVLDYGIGTPDKATSPKKYGKEKEALIEDIEVYEEGEQVIFVVLGDDESMMQELYEELDSINWTVQDASGEAEQKIMEYKNSIDFQRLNITVGETVAVEPGEGCYFPDESYCEGIMSREDPVIADAGGTSLGTYGWTIEQGGGSETFNVFDAYSILPPNYDDIDGILTIVSDLGNLEADNDAYLIPDEGSSQTKSVVECVAYKSTEYNSYPPWPYNITDPYLSAHACCGNNNKYLDEDQPCFNDTWVGPIYSFDKEKYVETGPEPPSYTINWEDLPGGLTITITKWSQFPPSNFPDELLNDIYERKVVRYCNSTRGNICTGKIIETITWLESCGGDDESFDEACSGAKISTGPYNAGCENYQPGDTYESIYKGIGNFGVILARNDQVPTGSCKHEKARGTGDGGSFDDAGAWMCESGCNGAGGCNVPANCICDKGNQCDGMSYDLIKGKAIAKYGSIYCDSSCNVVSGQGFDNNAAACIAEYGGPPNNYGPDVWNPARPPERRCCGNNDGPGGAEGGVPVDGACCENSAGCAIPGYECVEKKKIKTLNQGTTSQVSYLCIGGTPKTCRWVDECDVENIPLDYWWCSRTGWQELEGTTSDGMECGMSPPDTATHYCGVCSNGDCEPDDSLCPPSSSCTNPMSTNPYYQAFCIS